MRIMKNCTQTLDIPPAKDLFLSLKTKKMQPNPPKCETRKY